MGEVASAFVSLMPSAKGFGKGISNQIGGDLDSAGRTGGQRLGKGISGGFLPSIKGLMGPVAALFAVGAVVGFFKSANAEARESQKVGALTTQVIKTTGGVAKITAGQVGDLSMAISNKTGVDDEAIQHGANLLLTFKNVRNEVGKGAKVFDRATAAAVDLSAAGFGDVAGASKMLGKALNDPLKGITALGRAGVTFTAGQKKQIEAMVKAGDLLGAQKIIMKEVESQVGGAAAASATAGEKLTTVFGNFKETIGTALLPVIDKVASFLSERVIPAMSGFFTQMQNGTGAGGAFVGFLKGIWDAIQPIGTFIMGTVVPAVQSLFASFQSGGGPGAITGAFAGLVAFFQTQVVPAVMAIVTAIQGFVSVALPIVQAFVAGMMARFQPMLPTIMLIFATIGQIITAAMGLIQAVIQRVTTVISFIWTNWGGSIMSFISGVWSHILTIIQAALTIIQGVIKTVTSIIKGDWSGAWEGIKQILSGVWNAIKGIISAALNDIGGIMSAAWALIKLGVSAAWGAIKSAISSAWDGIKSAVSTKVGELVAFVKGIPGKIVTGLGNLGSLLVSAGGDLLRGLANGITGAIGGVIDAAKNAARAAVDAVKSALRISSPSKVFAEIGRFVGLGFIQGIDGTRAEVASTMDKLATLVRDTHNRGLIGVVSDARSHLLTLGSMYEAMTERIKVSLDKLTQMKADAASLASSVAGQVVGTGNFTGIEDKTFAGIVASLTSARNAAGSFSTVMARLAATKLNQTTISQLIGAGPASLEAAQSLLAAGATGIAQINALQAGIAKSALALGKTAANDLYATGIAAAQGLVKGLQSQEAALVAQMKRIADIMAKTVTSKLKIHSPSRVFADIGANIGQGLVAGIDGSSADVAASMRSLVSIPSLSTAGGLDISSVSRSSGGADRQPIVLQVDRQVLARVVVDVNNDFLRRNNVSTIR